MANRQVNEGSRQSNRQIQQTNQQHLQVSCQIYKIMGLPLLSEPYIININLKLSKAGVQSIIAQDLDQPFKSNQLTLIATMTNTPTTQISRMQKNNNNKWARQSSKINKMTMILHKYPTQYLKNIKSCQVQLIKIMMTSIKNNSRLNKCCQDNVSIKQIQKQLGMNGWAAIHHAVFMGNQKIVQFLISIGVDLNIKSFDQWLPIQLAIDSKNVSMINLLIDQPSLNVNICTAHGLPLNMAVKTQNVAIVKKILTKDVNFSAKDQNGCTVYDIIGPHPNKQMKQALQIGKRRQSLSYLLKQKNVMYNNLITAFKGEVCRIKPPPFSNKQYYLCINPYEKAIKIYNQKNDYPQFPKQIITINDDIKLKQMQKSQKSWYMKSTLAYFTLSYQKNKYILACNYQQTVKKWITAYSQCLKQIQCYPNIHKLKRNDTEIFDKVEVQEVKRKALFKNKDDIINIFTRKNTTIQKTSEKEIKLNCSLQLRKQTSQKQTYQKQQNIIPPMPLIQNEIASIASIKQWINKDMVKFADFKILKKIGQGSFGMILLALDMRNPQKQKHYALKTFKKIKLMKSKQIKYTMCQLNILKALSHPYIVNLHFTFQTLHYAYFGLDYCSRKDLSQYLMSEVTFSQNDAMIYTGEILLALQYLHDKHNIIYRDLKPENIMLDEQGHIKLIDFGLSKKGIQKNFIAKSFCGSPAYLSPEMLNKNGVRKQSDFYCLGTVLYQMIVGQPPFFANDVDTLYNNIKTSKLTFPKQVSQQAKNLLTGLLQRNPQKRLGFKGVQEIKSHKFFKNLNWNALEKRQIKAPTRQEIQCDDQEQTNFVQNIHKDTDYNEQNYRINRFINFNFVREENQD